MTKAQLIDAVVDGSKGSLTKKAAGDMLDGLFETMKKTIKKEGKMSYPGFGTWTLRNRKKRMGRNPQTGDKIEIKASKTVGFKPAAEFKKSLK